MTECAKIPTLEDIEQSKAAMDDIQAFTYSASDNFSDAKGETRDTVNGRIKKMGYAVPIAYAAAIAFTTNDNVKTVNEGSIIYAPKPSALPFTTSGTFIGDDDDRFFVVQGLTNDTLINDLSQSYEFKLQSEMVSSDRNFPSDKVIHTKDKDVADGGGGAIFDVVLTSTVTPNGDDIIQSAGVPTNSFVFRKQGTMSYGRSTTALNTVCVIRQAAFLDGFSYIDDANHTPSGFTGPITIDVPNLQINLPLTTNAKKIGTVSVTVDEKFAQKIRVGATFGLDKIGIKMYSNMNVLINNDTLAFVVNEFHNPAFISVVKNVDGSVTLDHPNVAINGGNNDPRTLQADGGGSQPRFSLIAQNASEVTYASFSAMTGQIQYDTGNDFDVFTGALAKPVAVWVTDHLEVSHEDVKSTFHNIPISFKETNFNYTIKSVDSTGFHVYFFDAVTGAAITSPISTLKFFYTVSGIDVRDEDTTGRCWVNVGSVQVDPAYVFNSSGNIWVNAVYEPVTT